MNELLIDWICKPGGLLLARRSQETSPSRGESSQWISGSELSAGMYLYALIVDGKEVDTKRMILTK